MNSSRHRESTKDVQNWKRSGQKMQEESVQNVGIIPCTFAKHLNRYTKSVFGSLIATDLHWFANFTV